MLFTKNVRFFPSVSFQIWELGAWTLSLQLVTGNSTTQGTFVNLTPNDWVQETHPLPRTLEQQTFFWHRSSCKGLTMQKPHHRTRLRLSFTTCCTVHDTSSVSWEFCLLLFFFFFSFPSFFKPWLPCADGAGTQCVCFGSESSWIISHFIPQPSCSPCSSWLCWLFAYG